MPSPKDSEVDAYQQRYQAHQKRNRDTLGLVSGNSIEYDNGQGGQYLPGMEALVQRTTVTGDGYVMLVHCKTHEAASDWHAEVQLPSGAVLEAGPGTRLEGRSVYPEQPAIAAGGHGVVQVRVIGTQRAPKSVQVQARLANGRVGTVRQRDAVVTDTQTRRTVEASDSLWPGSTTMSSSGEYGFGSGGGGGGGGQFELDVDFKSQRVRVRTDAGGGGGSGGGGQNGYYTGR